VNFGEHFEWDEEKGKSNLAKHGVAFIEAVAAFADPQRVILPDISHKLLRAALVLRRMWG
jgi:uncharacterized DUF497 family protein